MVKYLFSKINIGSLMLNDIAKIINFKVEETRKVSFGIFFLISPSALLYYLELAGTGIDQIH